jgi:hypothetical protein
MRNKISNIYRRKIHSGFLLVCIIAVATMITSCISYSFSGASIPPAAKTATVKTFPNNASMVNPTLSNMFTEDLRTKIQSQSNLTLVDYSGDLSFEGEITQYYTQPIAIQGDQTAALNRLTITINVRYTNRFDEKQNYEQSFSRYLDYSSSKNLSEVESDLTKQISELLIEDIYNKAFANW